MFKNHLKVSKGLLVPDANGNVNLTMWTIRCRILDRILFHIYISTPSRITKGGTYFNGKIHLTKIFELCANSLYIFELTDHMDAPSVFIHMRRQMFLENSLTSAKVSSHFLSQTYLWSFLIICCLYSHLWNVRFDISKCQKLLNTFKSIALFHQTNRKNKILLLSYY